MLEPKLAKDQNNKSNISVKLQGKKMEINNIKKGAMPFAMGVSLFALIASSAYAQENTDTGSVIKSSEEVVVTANRRKEKLQDVGVSAAAFNGQALTSLGIISSTALQKVTPGLSVNYANPSVSQVNIRGVSQNDFADHLEPPIAVYHDESYIGTSGGSAVPMFDMERVEVLRGPQGTLFGRNATGGLMHFISKQPTEELNGYLQGLFGKFNTLNLEGAIGGSLGQKVKGRIAFSYTDSDGPYKNVVTNKSDVGDVHNYAVRGILNFDISDKTELRIIAKYYNDDQHGPVWPFAPSQPGADGLGVLLSSTQFGHFLGGAVTAPCAGCGILGYKDTDGNPWTVASNNPGFFKREMGGVQLRLSHKVSENINLTLVSDFLNVDKSTTYDTDSSPFEFFTYSADQRFDQFSQEIRVDGETGNLKWVAGIYYLQMNGDYTQPLQLNIGAAFGAPVCSGLNCAVGPDQFDPRYSVDVQSFATFAQGEYKINEQFSATLGLRYTLDSKDFDYKWGVGMGSTWIPIISFQDSKDFDNVAIKAQLDWRPVKGLLGYFSYTRGHKGGNWAAPAFPANSGPPIDTTILPHDQEVLTSYEAGFKSRMLGNKLTLNGSIYHYDYQDYQAFSLLGISQSISNKQATVDGGEIEVKLNPIDSLDLSLSAAFIDTEVKDIILPNGAHVNRELPNSPDLQLTGLVRYWWSAFGGQMSVQASGKYMGDHYLTVLNEPSNFEEAYSTLDLRLGWLSPDKKLDLSIYGENVTDEYYRVWALDVSALSQSMSVPGARKTYGVRARYKF